MRKLILILVTIIVAPAAVASDFAGYDLVIPIAGRTPGAYGSNWRTDLYVMNTERRSASEPVAVNIVLSAHGVREQVIPVQIGPRATVVLKDVILQRFGREQAVGIIRIVAESPEAKLSARARIYNVGSSQGEYGQTVPAMPVTKLARESYVSGLSGVDGNRTNVGIANPASTQAAVFVSLFDQEGEFRGGFSTEVPRRSVLLLNDVFSHFTAGILDGATVQVTSSHGVYAYASVVRSDSGDGDFVGGTGVQIDDRNAIVAPSCQTPAPLFLSPMPASGWVVRFTDGTDTVAATASLAARFGFAATHVFETIHAFVADLNPATVAALRCEPAVQSIQQDGQVPFP